MVVVDARIHGLGGGGVALEQEFSPAVADFLIPVAVCGRIQPEFHGELALRIPIQIEDVQVIIRSIEFHGLARVIRPLRDFEIGDGDGFGFRARAGVGHCARINARRCVVQLYVDGLLHRAAHWRDGEGIGEAAGGAGRDLEVCRRRYRHIIGEIGAGELVAARLARGMGVGEGQGLRIDGDEGVGVADDDELLIELGDVWEGRLIVGRIHRVGEGYEAPVSDSAFVPVEKLYL